VYRLPGRDVAPTPVPRSSTPPNASDNVYRGGSVVRRYNMPARGSDSTPTPAPNPVRSQPRAGVTPTPAPPRAGDATRSLRDVYRSAPRPSARRTVAPPEPGRSMGTARDLAERYRSGNRPTPVDGRSGSAVRTPGVGKLTKRPIRDDGGAIKVAPRPAPGRAGHRYGVPGRAPTPTPIQRRPSVIAPIAKAPIAGAVPRTGATLVKTARPRLRDPRTGSGAIADGTRTFRRYGSDRFGSSYGHRHHSRFSFHGSLHHLGFHFGFGSGLRFGLYYYPYYYCSYYPRYYYNYCYDYARYWDCYYPSYSYCWWWPRTYCYTPIVYNYVYNDPGYGSYATVAYGGSSYDRVTRVSAGSAPVSKEALAKQHVGLGDFYFKEGRFKEASESYLRALTDAPDDATIHFVAADALFAIGDYHYAAYMIGEALRLDPDLAAAEADKRTFYSDPLVFDAQMTTLRDYIESKPYDAAAQLVLGYNLKFSADREGAVRAFERVLEIDPGNHAAKTFLTALRGPVPAADSTPPATDDPASRKSTDTGKE
jgi:hypothetical protein